MSASRGRALLAEVDRQLNEQRAQADALASRAGLMIGASAILAALLGQLLAAGSDPRWALILVAVSAVSGVVVFWMGRLVLGPSTSAMTRWLPEPSHGPAETSIAITDDALDRALIDSKLLAIEANARALLRTELVFQFQAFATVGAVILSVVYTELRS